MMRGVSEMVLSAIAASEREEVPSPEALRTFLGTIPSPVAIATARNERGEKAGVTISSFTAVSLQPPIVAWCLRSSSYSRVLFEEASIFAFNFLSDQQEALCRHFAQVRSADKFEGVLWQPGEYGAPVLSNCAATMVCEKVDQQFIGDHVMFFGETKSIRRTIQNGLVVIGPRLTSTLQLADVVRQQRGGL
jgi:flavin reductase (DIM6/NTAB) family NADH-FMN oxidoreductase RutF